MSPCAVEIETPRRAAASVPQRPFLLQNGGQQHRRLDRTKTVRRSRLDSARSIRILTLTRNKTAING
jgi:hypothetical protein